MFCLCRWCYADFIFNVALYNLEFTRHGYIFLVFIDFSEEWYEYGGFGEQEDVVIVDALCLFSWMQFI